MNIKEAKNEIKNAMKAYFTKDEFGEYVIPIEKQRPVFLLGAPGIGKTAIMEQVAGELGVALVSYSMTHHTRQSALGLPFIEKKVYGGKEYDVSEYTMSEIIASVYDMMEKTGIKEGILFLDEINCVSETLAPSMLQFLQYKVFGRHKVPNGWIVVTAGNPPEYNNSVREFDIVTWDRLKKIEVEPEYDAWKEYAYNSGVHASVTTYLDIKKQDFYKIETTVDGKSFVTARGWSDLSDMIKLYEKHGIDVNEKLVSQYLQNKKIAKEFSIYYDLFNKYKSDYQVDEILKGNASDEVKDRAKNAKFDERLSFIGLMLDAIGNELKSVYLKEQVANELLTSLRTVKLDLSRSTKSPSEIISAQINEVKAKIEKSKTASTLSADKSYILNAQINFLEETCGKLLLTSPSGDDAFKLIKAEFDKFVLELKALANETGKHLSNMFIFSECVFGDGQEMLIIVTELTISRYGAHFISRYGCDEYFKHNKSLLFYERQQEIIKRLEDYDI
jgi:hypothetical protein